MRLCDAGDTTPQNLAVRPVEHSSLQVPGRMRLVPIHAITIMYVLHFYALSILDRVIAVTGTKLSNICYCIPLKWGYWLQHSNVRSATCRSRNVAGTIFDATVSLLAR